MPQDVVQETVCRLVCPVCAKPLDRVWVTTLNKHAAPQVKAVERLGEHVVALAKGAMSRRLLWRCPSSILGQLVEGADGPLGVRELESAKSREVAAPAARSRR